MDRQRILNKIIHTLKEGKKFLITTHKDPDLDGVGSMLALGRTLTIEGKETVLISNERLSSPFNLLRGAEAVVQSCEPEKNFDAFIFLDCAEMRRIGDLSDFMTRKSPLINIDHHISNDSFGDLNLVDSTSSSTGELIFHVIENAGFPIDYDVCENIFVAIQSDTGSFRYNNTTPTSLRIASEMMSYGVRPWEVYRRLTNGYRPERLKLLQMALDTIEFYHGGKVGILTLTLEMLEKAKAHWEDSERFVDYPRFVSDVEIAVLIRQMGVHNYKFSLRSNSAANVSRLASRFGGGGHTQAAGFECLGSIETLKKRFLDEAIRFLDDKSNERDTSN
jgi:phosphoesterase RecJ-like protein